MDKAEYLLATDLDDTLVGDKNSLAGLNEKLVELRDKHQLKLAYITGRSLTKYELLRQDENLLVPDALVTALGTEIYWGDESQEPDWPHVANWDRRSVVTALDAIKELVNQPDSEQRPYKVSYYLYDSKILQTVKQKLVEFNVEVTYSLDKYLDVLPKGVNKGSALNYLARKWGINNENIIACGDSANDIAMLGIGKAIIVGGARKELIDFAEHGDNTYFAEQSFAAGIAEGLKYYGL